MEKITKKLHQLMYDQVSKKLSNEIYDKVEKEIWDSMEEEMWGDVDDEVALTVYTPIIDNL